MRPKDAASLLLFRESRARGVEMLMGRRHAGLRFMPGMLLFPGGRVDPGDRRAPLASELKPLTAAQLGLSAPRGLARALAAAAARELAEETGLVLAGLGEMDYLTRAITPTDRPMRFHARFLVAPAEAAAGTLAGSGELEELRFLTPDEFAAAPHAAITALIVREFLRWRADPGRALVRIIGRDTVLAERPAPATAPAARSRARG